MANKGQLVYNPEYHPDRFVALARKGWSIAQILAEFDISYSGYYLWRDTHPEFKAAIEKGYVHQQANAERVLDDMAQGGLPDCKVNAQIFKMRSQFREHYQEVKTIKNENTNSFNLKNLSEAQLDKLLLTKFKNAARLFSPEEYAVIAPVVGNVIDVEAVTVESDAGSDD